MGALQHLLPHQKVIGAVFAASDLVHCAGASVTEIFVAIAAGDDEHVARVDAAVRWLAVLRAALGGRVVVELDRCEESHVPGMALCDA